MGPVAQRVSSHFAGLPETSSHSPATLPFAFSFGAKMAAGVADLIQGISRDVHDRVWLSKFFTALVWHNVLSAIAFFCCNFWFDSFSTFSFVSLARLMALELFQSLFLVLQYLVLSYGSNFERSLGKFRFLDNWRSNLIPAVGFCAVGAIDFTVYTDCSQLRLGGIMGLLFTVHWNFRRERVLCFDEIRRTTPIEIKRRLTGVLFSSLCFTFPLFCLCAAFKMQNYNLFVPSMLCFASWVLGTEIFELVLSEGHSFSLASTQHTDHLVRALKSKNGVIQSLAFHDLCGLSEERCSNIRRSHFFSRASDGPQLWKAIASICITETKALRAKLEKCVERIPDGGVSEAYVAAFPVDKGLQMKLTKKAKKDIEFRWRKVCLCARSLAGLACASASEDKYGNIWLGEPDLGEITILLLEARLMVEHFIKQQVQLGLTPKPSRLYFWARVLNAKPTECHLMTLMGVPLHSVLKTCVFSLSSTFGDKLKEVAGSSRAKPAYLTREMVQKNLVWAIRFGT